MYPLHGEEADSESDNNLTFSPPLAAISAKRKQHAIFRAWMSQQAEADVQPVYVRGKRNAHQEQLSISQIIGEQESDHIIDDPREYQLELFERAKHQNTIAVLDTGTGKTLIAVLLLRYIIDQELDDRLAGKPHRIAFFLAPSVNLVLQQQAVLQRNLNYKTTRIYGDMGIDLWIKEKWESYFTANKVIVCTPDVIHLCLSHGFITMDRINLLIFDEAHHAKKSHPYCKVMRDFFTPLDPSKRPRVFGMTASPFDAKAEDEDIVGFSLELERNLASTIATTSTLAPLNQHVRRPRETTQYYPVLPAPSQTPLSADLSSKNSHLQFMRKLSARSSQLHAHLGAWCADRFWHISVSEQLAQRSNNLHAEKYARRTVDYPREPQHKKTHDLMREMIDEITSRSVLEPSLDTVSSKVLALHKCLEDFFSAPTDCRCIVFVRERPTAILLADLFNALGDMHLRSGYLIGAGSLDIGGPLHTLREQVLTLKKFRDGHLNCIFATPVAEEGLDVPGCNLIIRFDLCQTMIQYVQSRGRARHRNSTFVHMVESGNREHATMLDRNKRAEQMMKLFCSRLPADRRLTGNEDLLTPHILQHSINTFEVGTTGAKLTASNAVVFLAHFTSMLPNGSDEPHIPQYVVQPVAGGFICEVILPICSPMRGAQGKSKSSKVLAKCSAAFQTCVQLRKLGLLDEHLLPVYKDCLPTMRNAALALDLKGATTYPMKHKPTFWRHGQPPTFLHGVIVDFTAGLDRPHAPLIILSRGRLPQIPAFPVYLNSGLASNVSVRHIDDTLQPDVGQLRLLTDFTLRIFKTMFNKTYESEASNLSYWIAPTSPEAMMHEVSGETAVDWTSMLEACSGEDIPWSPDMRASTLIGKFFVDPYDGGKRYFTEGLAVGLRPTDPDPNPNHVKADGPSPTIVEMTSSLFKNPKSKMVWNPEQPVLIAQKVLHRRNMLSDVVEVDLESKAECYICPQPLRISRIATTFAATCYALPAVMWRIESHLIASEAFEQLQVRASPTLALEALTKDSDATDEYGENPSKIKFDRGMGRNYERLEFLGDTFLKMATTIDTYIRHPNDSEFDFHVRRMLQLCNANWFQTALELGLTEHIRSQSFSRRTWYPEGIKLLAGKGVSKQGEVKLSHTIGKKTVADVCEAIIGAAWLSDDVPRNWTPEGWDNAVSAVTKLVNCRKSDQVNEKEKVTKHEMLKWSDYSKAYIVPEWQKQEGKQIRGSEIHLADQIAALDGYRFKNVRLLHAAFTHPSMPQIYESVRSYQQLEFLGDSLLDMACVSHLIYNYPDEGPQWLTEHKMAMVANRFLGALTVTLGFHRNLRHNTSNLGRQIANYVEELEEAQRSSNGAKNFWTTVSDPPKCLADIVEAYVGAMFLDSDFDYTQVQRFFDRHMLHFFEDMQIYDTFANDHPVVRLNRLLNETFRCHAFRVFAEEEPVIDNGPARAYAAVVVHDRVVGGDVSLSTRYGKGRSAHNAFCEMEGLSVSQFRATYGCDCTADDRVVPEFGTAV